MPGCLRLLGDALADFGRGFVVAAVFGCAPRTSFSRLEAMASTLAPRGVDHLRVDVRVRAMHRQAHRFQFARSCARVCCARGAVAQLFFSLMLVTLTSSSSL